MDFTIGQLSHLLGVNADTIRHYREFGLLHPEAKENGYFSYHSSDLLTILLTKELRSQEMPLAFIKTSLARRSMGDYCEDLTGREAQLEQTLAMIRLELARIHETQIYASCGVRILNSVEEFYGPATWAVGVLDADGVRQDASLGPWIAHFPFTYVSATIPLSQLDTVSGSTPYRIALGSGALEKYVQQFCLPLPNHAFFQSGGHFIRTCIATTDVLHISPHDILPLLTYAKEHGYRFASHTGGRLLFLENAEETPLYYVLIWVRVEPA